MGGLRGIVKKGKGILLGEMGFCKGGGNINWFPGHMAAATRAIRDRLKLADLVIEVRDARVTNLSLLLLIMFIGIGLCCCYFFYFLFFTLIF